jgi:hypothetical protein
LYAELKLYITKLVMASLNPINTRFFVSTRAFCLYRNTNL